MGSAHNAIPRYAQATVAVPADRQPDEIICNCVRI